MITKLLSLLMLKLSRLSVAVKNAFRKKEPTSSEETEANETEAEAKTERRKAIKAVCEGCDYCEDCMYFDCFDFECLFADDDEGIPCYWEVDE